MGVGGSGRHPRGLCRYAGTSNIETYLIMPIPREGKKVTTAIAEENATSADGPQRTWTRTPEQEAVVADYLKMVSEMYADADPRYLAALRDETIMGTPELQQFYGYLRTTRIFQLYTTSDEMSADGIFPHPSAMPAADATGGQRGQRVIRGFMRGMHLCWALQSGRKRWDPISGQFLPQDDVNHGGAPRNKKN